MTDRTTPPGRDLSLTERDAFTLSETALLLDRARSTQDSNGLASALDRNLELWVGIGTLMCRRDSVVTGHARDNLKKLADYVTRTTLGKGVDMPPRTLDSLININLQISEGLLEGRARH